MLDFFLEEFFRFYFKLFLRLSFLSRLFVNRLSYLFISSSNLNLILFLKFFVNFLIWGRFTSKYIGVFVFG